LEGDGFEEGEGLPPDAGCWVEVVVGAGEQAGVEGAGAVGGIAGVVFGSDGGTEVGEGIAGSAAERPVGRTEGSAAVSRGLGIGDWGLEAEAWVGVMVPGWSPVFCLNIIRQHRGLVKSGRTDVRVQVNPLCFHLASVASRACAVPGPEVQCP
jgi:hypothetical protein